MNNKKIVNNILLIILIFDVAIMIIFAGKTKFNFSKENIQQSPELPMSIEPEQLTIKTGTGKKYYVDQTKGNDNYSGTEQQPFQTIYQANKKVEAGDIVYVKNGTYKEDITIQKSGVNGKWIIFQAFPGHKPYVIGIQDGTFRVEGNYIEINGFEITSTATGSGIYIGKGNNHIRIINNEIHDAGCSGIATEKTDYITIEKNVLYRNGFRSKYQCSGISLYQAVAIDNKNVFHNVIKGNISYSNENRVPDWNGKYTDGNGIMIDDFRNTQYQSSAPKYTPYTLIENNIVFNNGGRGIHIFQSDNVVVVNNTAFKNVKNDNIDGHLKGDFSTYFSSNILFYNNIAYGRDAEKLVFVDDYSNNNKWDYNLAYNGKILLGDGHSNVWVGSQNLIGVNPQFVTDSVDPNIANFRLKNNSPAIDKGTDKNAANLDLDGNKRPQGKGYDMGAYELK